MPETERNSSVALTTSLTVKIGDPGTRLAGLLLVRAAPNTPDGHFWDSLNQDQVRILRDMCDRLLGDRA